MNMFSPEQSVPVKPSAQVQEHVLLSRIPLFSHTTSQTVRYTNSKVKASDFHCLDFMQDSDDHYTKTS